MSTELLRIRLEAKQIRKACEDHAADMTRFGDQVVAAIDVPNDLAITVVFTKRRTRKPKGATP